MEFFDTYTKEQINNNLNKENTEDPKVSEDFKNYIFNDIFIPFLRGICNTCPVEDRKNLIIILTCIVKNDDLRFKDISSVQTWEELLSANYLCVICNHSWRKLPTKGADLILFGKTFDDGNIKVENHQACFSCKKHTKWIKNIYLISKFFRDYTDKLQTCLVEKPDLTWESLLGPIFSKRPIEKWTQNGPEIVKQVVHFRMYFESLQTLQNVTVIEEQKKK
jgi:hypothetical protein